MPFFGSFAPRSLPFLSTFTYLLPLLLSHFATPFSGLARKWRGRVKHSAIVQVPDNGYICGILMGRWLNRYRGERAAILQWRSRALCNGGDAHEQCAEGGKGSILHGSFCRKKGGGGVSMSSGSSRRPSGLESAMNAWNSAWSSSGRAAANFPGIRTNIGKLATDDVRVRNARRMPTDKACLRGDHGVS